MEKSVDIKKRLSLILLLAVSVFILFCFGSCGSYDLADDKESICLITCEEEPDTESILSTCGLNSDGYEVSCFSIPEASDDYVGDGDYSTHTKARINDTANNSRPACSITIFQVGSNYNQIAYDFMADNPDRSVFILDPSGTEVLDSQNEIGDSEPDN